MFKSYQSINPCQSRILKARWDRKYYEEHRDKVREAKPMVDTKPPTTYVHLHLKLKKLQLEEERYATIERDNRILLEKMSQIMRNKGRVDNHNSYVSKSLNREKRQQELLRITRENQEILKRILAREPEYNHLQWDREWEENEKFMDSIARYPRDWWQIQQEEEQRWREEKKEKRRKEKSRSKSRTGRKSRTKSREESPLEEREEDTTDETETAREDTPKEQGEHTDDNSGDQNGNDGDEKDRNDDNDDDGKEERDHGDKKGRNDDNDGDEKDRNDDDDGKGESDHEKNEESQEAEEKEEEEAMAA